MLMTCVRIDVNLMEAFLFSGYNSVVFLLPRKKGVNRGLSNTNIWQIACIDEKAARVSGKNICGIYQSTANNFRYITNFLGLWAVLKREDRVSCTLIGVLFVKVSTANQETENNKRSREIISKQSKILRFLKYT